MNKAAAVKVINELGASLDEDFTYITRSEKSVMVDAPEGFHWAATEASTLTVVWYDGSASEFWGEVVEMLNEGLIQD